jgi:HD superfamily phosphohydrolase
MSFSLYLIYNLFCIYQHFITYFVERFQIVANDRNGVDVDKWDYLARDSHMLGLNMTLDYERCFTSARVIQSNGASGSNGTNDEHAIVSRKQICYREKVNFNHLNIYTHC